VMRYGRARKDCKTCHDRQQKENLTFHGTPHDWRDYPIAIRLCQ
jgi:hypothetical protein